MIDCVDTCEHKANLLETIVTSGMDILIPMKTKTIITSEPRWVNSQLKSFIQRRRQAYANGDLNKFRLLRNRVNRLRKKCRSKFYKSKVEHQRRYNPWSCWKEVKTHGGMTSTTRADPLSIPRNIDGGDNTNPTNLSNVINNSFLSPISIFSPLVSGERSKADISTLPLATKWDLGCSS